jgi:hypothetical protein
MEKIPKQVLGIASWTTHFEHLFFLAWSSVLTPDPWFLRAGFNEWYSTLAINSDL